MTIQCWDNDYKTWPHPATKHVHTHKKLMSELNNRQTDSQRVRHTNRESDSHVISQTQSEKHRPTLGQNVRKKRQKHSQTTDRQTDTPTLTKLFTAIK